jgi:hypothetical protein
LKFEPDPRGIGYAFHRAGAEIGEKGGFCEGLNDFAEWCHPPPINTGVSEKNNFTLLEERSLIKQ